MRIGDVRMLAVEMWRHVPRLSMYDYEADCLDEYADDNLTNEGRKDFAGH